MYKSLLILLAVGLTACPSPADERSHVSPPINDAQQEQPAGPYMGGGQADGTESFANNEEGEPPAAGGQQGPLTGHVADYGSGTVPLDEAGEGDMRLIDPTHSQQDIAGAPHYEVSGRVVGACGGDLRIDVLSTRPISGEAGATGPMTALSVDSAGEFTVLIPEGDTVEVVAVCDENGDGVIRGGDSLSAPENSAPIGSARSDILLRLDLLDSVLSPTSGGFVRE